MDTTDRFGATADTAAAADKLLERICDAGATGLDDLTSYQSAACRQLAQAGLIVLRSTRMIATDAGTRRSIANCAKRIRAKLMVVA